MIIEYMSLESVLNQCCNCAMENNLQRGYQEYILKNGSLLIERVTFNSTT